MTTAAKAVNYTEEQTVKVIADYTSGVSIDEIAEKMGRSTRSIIAKLSREGVYKKKEKDAISKAALGKADMASEIAQIGNMTNEEARDMTKLTKQTLVNLLALVRKA